MIYCFECIFKDDKAVAAPGHESSIPSWDRDKMAQPAVTIVNGQAKCIEHFSRDHNEPIRVVEPS